jgi:hypothetical protein
MKNQTVFMHLPISLRNPAQKIIHLCIALAETFKIGVPGQQLREPVHGFHIQWPAVEPAQVLLKWVFMKMEMVLIGTRKGIEARMRIRMYRDDPFHGYVGSGNGIQCPDHTFPAEALHLRRNFRYGLLTPHHLAAIEMRKELGRMHPCIGTPAAQGFHRFPQYRRQCTIEGFLYGSRVILLLPSMVTGAFVSDFDKIPLHGCKHKEKRGLNHAKPLSARRDICKYYIFEPIKSPVMIQRIQSLYLFLASVALALLFFLPIYSFDKTEEGVSKSVKISVSGKYEKVTDHYVLVKANRPLMIMNMVIGLGLLALIFQYNNRKRQLRITRVMVILEFSLMIFVFSILSRELQADQIDQAQYGIGAFLPTIAVLLTTLAARGIKRDEQLVQSANRIR